MPKSQQHKSVLRLGATLVILAIQTAAWAFVWDVYYLPHLGRAFAWKGNLMIALVYALLLLIVTGFYGGFRVGYYRPADIALSGVIALVFTNTYTWLQTSLIFAAGTSQDIVADIVTPLPILCMTAVQAVFASVWALQMGKLYTKLVPPHQLLLVYGGKRLAKQLVHKMVSREEKYRIQESIDISEGLERVKARISSFSTVVLCDVKVKERNALLKYCFEQGIRTYTTPKISDILVRGATYINLFDSPLLLSRNAGLNLEQRVMKRTLDLVLAGLGLIALSPVMLIIALAIKIQDGGPVFYKQNRLTIDGQEFWLHKFRSMRVDAEKETGALLSVVEDDRITAVGQWIRRFRLDELPQLLDILRGDMSLVGPRPERPEIAKMYLTEIPEFSYRLKVKAGLTGFAQVVGRYNTTPYDKLKMDLMYISNYSVAEDIKLIATTLKILFFKDKTSGIGPAEEIAMETEAKPQTTAKP